MISGKNANVVMFPVRESGSTESVIVSLGRLGLINIPDGVREMLEVRMIVEALLLTDPENRFRIVGSGCGAEHSDLDLLIGEKRYNITITKKDGA